MKRVLATVISHVEILPACYLVVVKAPDIAIASRPGQFVMIRCGDNLVLRRPISIHRVTESGEVKFLFNAVKLIKDRKEITNRPVEASTGKGDGTLWLSRRREGDKLDLLGPLGKGFTVNSTSRNLLLISGGIGVAPLVFLAEQAVSQGKTVRLLLGARTKNGLYPESLLPKRIEVAIFTEDGSAGKRGMVSEHIDYHLAWADQVYACGPKAMYQAIAEKMVEKRIDKTFQVSLEVRMGCGIGACYGCSVMTKRGIKQVCFDGPVFDFQDVLLEEVRL